MICSRYVREGLANLATSGARGLLLGVASVTLATGALLADAITIRSTFDRELRYVAAGGTSIVLDGPLSAGTCDSLADDAAVFSAGGYQQVRGVSLSAWPTAGDVGVTAATPGFVSVLETLGAMTPTPHSDEARGPSVYVPTAIAENQGISPSFDDQIVTVEGARLPQLIVTVAGLIDIGRVAPSAAGTVVIVDDTLRHVDGCIIVMRPGTDQRMDELVAEATPQQVGRLRPVHDLLTHGDFTDDPFRSMSGRHSRWLWLMATIAITLLWGTTLGFRSTEVGLYRSVGMSRGAVAAVRFVEGFALLGATLTVSWAALAVVASRRAGLQYIFATTTEWQTLAMAAAGTAGVMVTAVLSSAFGSPAALVKDR